MLRFGDIFDFNHCLTSYLFTPWGTVFLEKWKFLSLVKKFPAFHGTRRFITTFERDRHLSLSAASSIQSISTHPCPEDPSKWFFPSRFPTKTLYTSLLFPECSTRPAHHILLDLITQTTWGYEYRSSLCSFLHSPINSFLLGPNILLYTLFSKTFSQCILYTILWLQTLWPLDMGVGQKSRQLWTMI